MKPLPFSLLPARRTLVATAVVAALLATGAWVAHAVAQDRKAAAPAAGAEPAPRAALSVAVVSPVTDAWPVRLTASGSVAAWQEAVLGAEVGGYPLVEVSAQVGDRVRKGQLLARLAADTVEAELAQARAALAEAQAQHAEARANAERARAVEASGALSAQQVAQYLTADQTAAARLASARAALAAQELRLAKTRIVAPSDGIVSARTATPGSLVQTGQELFRLIRDGRLEWRAEVTAAELARLRPGQSVRILAPGGGPAVPGRVRVVAPTVDPQTRNALVYVDVQGEGLRAGMFARGEFDLGAAPALTVPASAVVLRDGFGYVYSVVGSKPGATANGRPGDKAGDPSIDMRVEQRKVALGRRQGDRIEVLDGLPADARVVASGGGFLADGDRVRIVEAAQ